MNLRLSIVLASHNARASVEDCLHALAPQIIAGGARGEPVELIIVDNSTDGTLEILHLLQAQVAFEMVQAPPSALIPRLWSLGIARATGEVVALTTAHCVPNPDWIEQIQRAHRDSYAGVSYAGVSYAGVGGAISIDPKATLVQRAIYFCRYSAFMPPFRETPVSDIAADNASYKRVALESCVETWRDGFWEPAVHAALCRNGAHLLKTPNIVVEYRESFSLSGFCRQRFQHGKQFGRERAARFSRLRRFVYIFLSPLIPFVLLARISRAVASRGSRNEKFGSCLPVLILFLLSWSAGEVCGYLKASRE